MAQRFISRTSRRKFIRPVRNSMINNRVEVIEKVVETKEEEKPQETVSKVVEETVVEKKPAKRTRKKSATKKEETTEEENNEKNTEPMNENIEKLKKIVGDDVEIPAQTVKYEKKDKGLIERTENSTILITEENKMLLND